MQGHQLNILTVFRQIDMYFFRYLLFWSSLQYPILGLYRSLYFEVGMLKFKNILKQNTKTFKPRVKFNIHKIHFKHKTD